jgi:hypothetical protein
MLNERIKWQEEVEAHFQEGMERLKDFGGSDMTDDGYKEKLLVSYLSDVQELITLNPSKASEHINRIKFMINNCY